MTRTITLRIFEDPGHGWARFPKARLTKLGIANQISSYSYQKGVNAFLEEDCDLSTLISSLTKLGYDVKFKTNHSNRQSKIRSYQSYKA